MLKPEPRWRDLYRLASIASILVAAAVIFAIAAYFIWPYQDSSNAMESIFHSLQTERLGGLFSLDLVMLLITPVNLLMFLAIYTALKQVNASYALVALVLIIIAVVLVIQCRPLIEMVILSDKFTAANSAVEKAHYLIAGETLHAYFSGTAWVIQTIFFMIAGLIFSLLMLRVNYFGKATAWLGIFNSIVGMGFFLPKIGLLLLFINTIGSIPWCILVAMDFFRILQDPQKPTQ
jgi:hypothetical protein